jgi:hypothetical protein
MFDFTPIETILEIDPSYIALFAAMVFGFTQAIKNFGEFFNKYAQAVVYLFSGVLATLIVLQFNTAVMIIALTQVISAAASGLYSWGKKGDLNIKFPDYSDEK